MSFFTNRFCPECGALLHRGWQECLSCSLQKGLTKESAPIVSNPHPWDVRRWLWRLSLVVVAAIIVIGAGFWGSQLLGLDAGRDTLSVRSKDTRIVGTSLHESGERLSFIRVYELQEQGVPALQVVVDDLHTGQRLSISPAFPLVQGAQADWAQFRSDASGAMLLLLQKKQLLEFHADVQHFVDVTPALAQIMAERYGAHIDSLEFQSDEWPEALLVSASDGRRYYLHWPSRRLLPQDEAASVYAAEQQQYTQVWQSYGLAPSANAEPGMAYVVRYLNKGGSGQMVHRPAVPLYRMQEDHLKSQLAAYQPVGNGFALRVQDARTPGLIRADPIAPMRPRANPEVLAVNASRVLIAFDAADGERILQLLDRDKNRALWSQRQSQIPELAGRTGGVQLQAAPVARGFYLRNGWVTPVLLIGNNGQVLFDFSRRDGGNMEGVSSALPVSSDTVDDY